MGRRKLLIIGLTWPEPKATAAGFRMMQLIRFFKKSGWSLTLASTAGKNENTEDLSTLDITCESIQLNDDSFDFFLQKLKPDMVLFDRYITEEQFGWRVAEKLPQCIRILDTEDLHSLRIARRMAVEHNKPFALRDWTGLEQTKRELASIYRSDLSLIISRYELRLLREELKVPAELLLYLPFWSDEDEQYVRDSPGFSSRKHFVFIGNGRHKPNIDAIRYLSDTIWPAIRKMMPEARLHVYGAYLPETVNILDNPERGFHVKGYVENADLAMQRARINLVPLRYGAGLKGKLLLALKNGTPSITTSIGAEGLLDHSIASEFIFDEPLEFAREAVRLYESEKEWLLLQEIGFDVLKAKFNNQRHEKELSKAIDKLTAVLEEHRSRNFVGAMLQYHSMQSTKYLSKWITLKNQTKTPDQGS